ncbi:hypothetical protein WJX84_012047 [Apatococcus fuscideae]|uniref:UDENN domain-containing protein n=1 Tax=Apatococcus fuscideae TaxID=2026836 RepID=A0AAW1SSC4_9CHLO
MLASPAAWLTSICSVIFDIDVGQRLEDVYPPESLDSEDGANIAMHSFPDSLSFELQSKTAVRDSTFFFRIPQQSHLRGAASHASFLYGCVFCRQRQDERLRRGGEQKSVVVLSGHPYISVLEPLTRYAGMMFFNNGPAALQTVFEEVALWPHPDSGSRLIVNIGGLARPFQVPDHEALPLGAMEETEEELQLQPWQDTPHGWLVSKGAAEAERLQGLFNEADIYTPLRTALDRLWTLWEHAVLAEPLLVIAPSPGECSAAVAALTALITPLPYSCDFRPYFSIHDSEFQAMAESQLPEEENDLPTLIGITNVFFIKALSSWPNILSVGHQATAGNGLLEAGRPASASRLQRLNPGNALKAVRRRAAGAQILISEHVPGLWATYKPLLSPDTALLKSLLDVDKAESPAQAKRFAETNSEMLREHFYDMTAALLVPFAPYCQPALPGEAAELAAEPGPLPIFDPATFLETLPLHNVPRALHKRLGSQEKVAHFYQRFVASRNFKIWMVRQQAAAVAWQERAWQRAQLEHGIQATRPAHDMPEVQLVGLFLEVEQQLANAEQSADSGDMPLGPTGLARRASSNFQMIVRLQRRLQEPSHWLSPEPDAISFKSSCRELKTAAAWHQELGVSAWAHSTPCP